MHKNYICIAVHLIFHHVVYITSASEHQHTCNKSFIFSWLAEGMHSHWFPCFNWSWLTATGRHHTQYSSRSINSHTHTHTHHISQAEPTDPSEEVSFSFSQVLLYSAQMKLNTAPYCHTFTVHSLQREGSVDLHVIIFNPHYYWFVSFSTLPFITSTAKSFGKCWFHGYH